LFLKTGQVLFLVNLSAEDIMTIFNSPELVAMNEKKKKKQTN